MESTLRELEKRLHTAIHPLERADLLIRIGSALRNTDPERMVALSREAQTLLQKGEHQTQTYARLLGANLELLGYYYFLHGDFETAYDYYQSAIHYFIQIYDDISRCNAWTYSCMCHAHLGNWADAMEEAVACLDLAVSVQDRVSEIKLWLVMGTVYSCSGDHMRSVEVFAKALHLATILHEPAHQIEALHKLANAYIEIGDHASGVEYALKAQEYSRQQKYTVENVHILYVLAKGVYLQGNLEQAFQYYQECYVEAEHSEHLQASALLGQGQIHLARDNVPQALETLLRALPLAETTQTQPTWYECHRVLADVYATMKEWSKAFFHHKQYHTLKESVFNTESDLRLKMLEVTFRTEDAQKRAEQVQKQAAELEMLMKERIAELETEVKEEIERRRRHEDEKSNLLDVARRQGEQLQNLTLWVVSQQLPEYKNVVQALFEGYLQNLQLLVYQIDVAAQIYLDKQTAHSGTDQAEAEDDVLKQLQHVTSIGKRLGNTLRSIADSAYEPEGASSAPGSALLQLSNREREVMKLIAQGKSTSEISQALVVTEGTVRTYRYRIMQKLDIDSAAGLIHYAIQHQQSL